MVKTLLELPPLLPPTDKLRTLANNLKMDLIKFSRVLTDQPQNTKEWSKEELVRSEDKLMDSLDIGKHPAKELTGLTMKVLRHQKLKISKEGFNNHHNSLTH